MLATSIFPLSSNFKKRDFLMHSGCMWRVSRLALHRYVNIHLSVRLAKRTENGYKKKLSEELSEIKNSCIW